MDTDDQGTPSPGAALLLIIGEPFSDDHKNLILEEVTKGFKCWDAEDTGIDINDELSQIASRASLGEEGANGERLIQHQSDTLSMEILINPLTQSVKNSLKKLLVASSPTKYVIYAGHAFQGTGAWVLQDDVFSFSSFAQVFKNTDVENALKQNIEANLTIHTLEESNWGQHISKADFTNNLRIQLNPPEKLENIHGVSQFTAYVGIFVTHTPITKCLQASEQFGSISFTRPTLYIFPGCQGDSALFGINGFNLLVNGGYNRRACFWDFARHLDRVDAMLLTHLGPDNIFGVNTALMRKSIENIHPQIGYMYFNAFDKPGSVSPALEGDKAETEKKPSLLVNLAEEANNMVNMAKQLGIAPQPCSRPEKSPNVDPINLYHKLGHGSLDMYVLNPVSDSKELKEFHQNWSKKASNLGSTGPFPLQNALSVCTILVWRPHNVNEKIIRIFFPGNAPQHKIAEGLEKMKSFAFLKHASCTAKDLQKPAPVKKAAASARPGSGTTKSSSRSTASSRADASRSTASSRATVESPRKADSRSARSGAVSPVKSTRETKTRSTAMSEKVKDSGSTRPSSARGTASSAAKASSPRKTPSPTKALTKSPSPTKSPPPAKSTKSPTKSRSPEKSISEEKPSPPKENQPEVVREPPANNSAEKAPETEAPKVENHMDQQEVKPEENLANDKPAENGDVSTNQVKVENLGVFDGGDAENLQQFHVNGENNEEVVPQALPEPPAMTESPTHDSMPDYTSKIKTDQQELSDFSKVEEELEQLEDGSDSRTKSFDDPASYIPPSPEPNLEEQSGDYNDYPVPCEPKSAFETPVFSNDGPDTGMSAKEQKIQYGIDESSRAMEGIQEEEEPEEEGEEVKEKDDFQEKDLPEDQSSDDRLSAERQLDDEDCGENESSLPAAFDRDSSPEMESRKFSDDDKDIDETALPKVNGTNHAMNGFDTDDDPQLKSKSCSGENSDNLHQEGIPNFDPVAEWGQPMGLPSPPPASPQKSGRPASAASSRTSSKPASTTGASSRGARTATSTTSRTRPSTAPAKTGAGGRPTSGTKRGGTGSARSSPQSAKIPPLPPMTAFYMDLTYIPNHGDPMYSDVEFFKRVRARYYVLSSLSPNIQALDSLMEAKSTWENKDLEVTLIPTYDNDTLRHWVGLNKEKLQELRIDLTPAVSRCTIQLQDLETCLPAYRLEV